MKILFNPMKEPDKYCRLCIAAKLDSPVVQVVTTLKRLYWLEWKYLSVYCGCLWCEDVEESMSLFVKFGTIFRNQE